MKGFSLELNHPPNGVYFPGMMVSGTVTCEVDEPKSYKQIIVKLTGKAEVSWNQAHNRQQTRRYSAKEEYISSLATLWDKTRDGQDGKFPIGLHRFNFSFQLTGTNLPASFTGLFGSIKYILEARIVKEGLLSKDTVATTALNVANKVRIDEPEFTQPLFQEVRKTLCCLFCASAPIVITARLPRSAFCIGHGTVPLEVTVENGSGRTIRDLCVTLEKETLYFAEGQERTERRSTQLTRSQPVPAHDTLMFRPDNLQIPLEIPPTIRNSGILSFNYSLKVTASLSFDPFVLLPISTDPFILFPIVVGNVPPEE